MEETPSSVPPEDNASSHDSDARFDERFFCMEVLALAHSRLARGMELDDRFTNNERLSKSFVSQSAGYSTYPFPHMRIRLTPCNRVASEISVVGLRYPVISDETGERLIDPFKVFVAWKEPKGERAFALTVGGFYRLDLPNAFSELSQQGDWPTPAAMALATEEEKTALQMVLDHKKFEPDLQRHDPDIAT